MISDAFGLLGLLLLLLGRRDESPAQRPKPPYLPASGPPTPWPAALPPELPRFPGNGWEYDEPPPPAVQERARQLVPSLWKRGKGSHQTEQTGGRWITYRAEIVRSGNQGIVAYRLRTTAALPPGSTQTRAPAPAPAARPPSSARSPGVPQKAAPDAQTVPVSFPSSPAPSHVPFPVPGGVIYTSPAAPAPASALGLPVLRRGRGMKPAAPDRDVMLLQQKLGITPDGRFGPNTEKEVRAFQGTMAINKLGWSQKDVDGVVGPKTWTALFASPWVRT